MEALQLNKEQREQLLLLISEYFPEYHHVRYGNKWDSDEIWFSEGEDADYKNHEIHWFEFVMRILLPKMTDGKEPLCYYEEYLWGEPAHPVDYAWKIN